MTSLASGRRVDVRTTALDPARLKAIVFDLDGTLYRQERLRRGMLLRLARAHVLHPLLGLRTARALAAYRQAQETLRDSANETQPSADLAEQQIELAARLRQMDGGFVSACVGRWMEREPLGLMASCIQPGLVDFLQACRRRGLRMGLFSDYPAEAKLHALGLAAFFDVVVSAQSVEVGVFKPNPRGLQVVARHLGASPAECAYIGDRPAVDARAAAAAQMACFILTRRIVAQPSDTWQPIASYPALAEWLNQASTAAERRVLPAPPTI